MTPKRETVKQLLTVAMLTYVDWTMAKRRSRGLRREAAKLLEEALKPNSRYELRFHLDKDEE